MLGCLPQRHTRVDMAHGFFPVKLLVGEHNLLADDVGRLTERRLVTVSAPGQCIRHGRESRRLNC